jgi:hypothetical protein
VLSRPLSSGDIFQHRHSFLLMINPTKSRMMLMQLLYAANIKYSLPTT